MRVVCDVLPGACRLVSERLRASVVHLEERHVCFCEIERIQKVDVCGGGLQLICLRALPGHPEDERANGARQVLHKLVRVDKNLVVGEPQGRVGGGPFEHVLQLIFREGRPFVPVLDWGIAPREQRAKVGEA